MLLESVMASCTQIVCLYFVYLRVIAKGRLSMVSQEIVLLVFRLLGLPHVF